MKNNTMIPYNVKKDLETNYYDKTEVELLLAGGSGSGGSIDLSNYYKKLETYSKAQVDALVAGGGADLSDYYTKAEVESLISAIPATDLTNYYDKTQTETLLSNKVDKVIGKGLSTNDFTDTFKQAYDGHLASTSNPHNTTANQVGAYSKIEVDNLLDKKANLDINNKIPLSEIPDSILGQLKYMGVWDFSSGFPTGAQKGNYWITSVSGNGYEVGDWAVYNGTSFDKVDNTDAVSSVAGRTGNVVLNKNDVGLNNVDNTSDLNKPISTATQTALNSKVDKVAGKGLSTEDYTTTEKTKLTGLSNYTKPVSEPISYITGLQTALDSKVSKTGVETLHSTDALRISGTTLSLYKGDGTFESVVTQDTVYTLPKASATVLGGIKVGTNLSIDANGVLSANDTNVSFTEISNKPTNLSGYGITDAYTKTQVDSLIPNISTKQDTLVSGTNIKTINGQSVLGGGDLVISGGGSVQLTGNQTIAGIKTFSSNPISTATQDTAVNALTRKDYVDSLDNTNVKLTGDQTVAGVKTFSSTITGSISGNSATATKLATARTINGVSFDGSTNITISDATAVKLTGDETIAGIKTFSSNIVGNITGNSGTATSANSAYKWTNARTITMGGDLSGSVSIDGSANVTLAATVANDSHTHEFANLTSRPTTLQGYGVIPEELPADIDLDTKTITGLYSQSYNVEATLALNYPAAVAGLLEVFAYATMIHQRYWVYNSGNIYYRAKFNNGAWTSWTKGANVNDTVTAATKLATARTINGVAFDGSVNITVSDDTKLTKTNPSITGSVTEQVYNLTLTVINPTNGTIQYKTVSSNTTFTETLISGQSVLLRLINANSYTITFPTITWVGADAPILTANCAIALWKEQSTLYGAYIGTLVW